MGMVQVAPSRASTARSLAQGFYIPSLDGFRAGAVLLVFLSHAITVRALPGNFGVTVFFFLSGYLITTLLRMEYERSQAISLRDFYLRRILRIFPPFYLVLLSATLLTGFGFLKGSLDPSAFLFQFFYLTNYYVIDHGWWTGIPGSWVYWSLAVEEHFYLAFPLCYLLLRRHVPSARIQALILGSVCALVLLWRFELVFGLHAIKERTYIATDTRIDSILFGCILAIVGNPTLDPPRVSERHMKWVALPLSLVALLGSLVIQSPWFQESIRYTIQGIALYPVFICAIRYPQWGPFRILNFAPVRFMGILSYSFYLLHPTVIYGVQQWLPVGALLQGLISFTVTLLLCVIIYRFVEQPCARLRRRLSHIGQARRAVATAPARPVVAGRRDLLPEPGAAEAHAPTQS
ncbi:MAG: acyltransferase [Chloroflexi bacterium]|nr:acyltransferase [Chloroflexota bacterium]